jgi:hypothetical protein
MTYNDTQAKREGWALFTIDDFTGKGRSGLMEIQRLDDPQACFDDLPAAPIFASDDEAIAFVTARAKEGSDMHRAALDMHGKPDPLYGKETMR